MDDSAQALLLLSYSVLLHVSVRQSKAGLPQGAQLEVQKQQRTSAKRCGGSLHTICMDWARLLERRFLSGWPLMCLGIGGLTARFFCPSLLRQFA